MPDQPLASTLSPLASASSTPKLLNSSTLIIGAGISGLALGRTLTEKRHDNRILEATGRVGGVIDTVVPEGTAWQLNYGANTLFVDDEVMDFLLRTGLGPNWVEPLPLSKARFILKGDEYAQLPGGPLSLLFGNFFSLKAKLRILKELRLRPATSPPSPLEGRDAVGAAMKSGLGGEGVAPRNRHETVYAFFLRHFGPEVCDLAVQPFLAGIYAGDAKQLLMELVFPNLLKLEEKYGSLLKGLRKEGLGTGRRKSISFVMGMRELCEALADMTQAVQGQTRVESIQRIPNGNWQATSAKGDVYEAQNLVLALPAYEAARLLATRYPAAAVAFSKINYAQMAQVHLGFRTKDIGRPLQGFGGLHPPEAEAFTSGVLWISAVLPMRAPADHTLLVAFVGGVNRTDIAPLSDEQLLDHTEAELHRLYQIEAPATLRHLRRWPQAIPQYDKNLLGIAQIAKELEADNLYIHSNYIGGVSVQDCIKKSLRLADEL